MALHPDLKDYLDSGEYLPEPLRDFHDQKKVFKRVDEMQGKGDPGPLSTPISWRDAHIYTIDKFLWFMAVHGLTLQRSRKKVPFADLDVTIKEFDERQMQMMKRFFDACKEDTHA